MLGGFMKKKFEQWAKNKELDTTPYYFNEKFKDEFDYEDIQTQMFWECWKASSQPITPADAEKCPNCVMGYLDIIIPRCSHCGYEKRR
jgi:hypothetical protein